MSSPSDTLIRLTDVGITIDRRAILSGATLDICRGDFIAITGPNGGGKTTLLRIILRLLKPTSGCVTYEGEAAACDFRIGYLPQKNKIDSRFPITVASTVELGLLGRKDLTGEQRRAIVKHTLERIGLSDHAGAPIGTLSGGQLQRTLLGRAIISQPKLLVLDEPLSYLDKHFEHHVYNIIGEMAPHTTILLVSHDVSTIAQMANRHIIVDHRLEYCHSSNHFLHYNCCDHEECSAEIRNFASHSIDNNI
ncbi:MAG: ATP-binding cassette domain-containing protein [Paramuribaculum sp.]|nr:ATP-binding cassette domain-containing protein [Paramuribaculum sp.]MDE6782896.1 ATP-binding cassette domain-containing protein [Paramuribaculum sp.]